MRVIFAMTLNVGMIKLAILLLSNKNRNFEFGLCLCPNLGFFLINKIENNTKLNKFAFLSDTWERLNKFSNLNKFYLQWSRN